jgi:hypothetical protein
MDESEKGKALKFWPKWRKKTKRICAVILADCQIISE